MMCNFCDVNFSTLIESEKIGNMIWLFANRNHELKNEDIDEIDNSLCMEIRNGQGYLRLGNRDEMQCIDHSENIKINYCPFCGRELMRKEEE